MVAARASTVLVSLLATAGHLAAAHYSGSCASDEVAGEIQGETGVVCAPKCTPGTFECALDTPSGTTAQPQCMLQNVDNQFFCGLLCQLDSQCPSGASCRKVGGAGVGVCINPLSFADWAKQSSRTKLGIGFPQAAGNGQSSKGFRIAKAYSALSSLKRRFSIPDGDGDVLVVKEMLSAVSSTSNLDTGARAALASFEHLLHKAEKKLAGDGNTLESSLENDVKFFTNNLAAGIPGLEREAESVMWKVEHIDQWGAASGLLRGVIEVGLIYLVLGGLYKYQAMGARGVNMIPHLDFWVEYPELVMDGVKYSQQILSQFVGGSITGGFQPMSSAVERDTFSHFEPSK
eukprot:TRINITY_DN7926_c0_g1_i1.p1 TRINITY_DN7926_c0_g1~~TRINITY_DN7926_c0_g1_i1.p1  ORF type:complete len:358 (+),score=61.93 TRINITY_DN7926_c0_g1_i1:39-1076(+)